MVASLKTVTPAKAGVHGPGETNREWGTTISMTPEVKTKIDAIWQELGI